MHRAQLFFCNGNKTVRIEDRPVNISLKDILAGVTVSMVEDHGPFWQLRVQEENFDAPPKAANVEDTSSATASSTSTSTTTDSETSLESEPVTTTTSTVVTESTTAVAASHHKPNVTSTPKKSETGWKFLTRRRPAAEPGYSNVLRDAVIPREWSIAQSSLVVRQFGDGKKWLTGKVAAFDFDDTLVQFFHG